MNEEDKFFEEVKSNPKPKYTIPVDGRVFPFPKGELLEMLKGLDSLSDEQAYGLISREFYSIMNDIFNHKSKDYRFLLRSPKFLSIMIQVVNTHNIGYDETIHCNSFIYNFLIILNQSGEESYIQKLLFMLGEALNKQTVRRLVGCEISENLAIFLAVSLKSSFEPGLNIRRLNFALATAMPTMITDKKVIEIYESVFDNVGELIIQTIFDKDIVNAVEEEWVTEEVYQADQIITYAVMIILESMVPIEITHVLLGIAEYYKWKNYEQGICKIDFHKLNKNIFIKTNVIVEQLEGDGHILP
jgi:hypothetical protein|nr:MAG TPA: hypothetical protein [Caudoviricetes sp.]